jgi:hypothetical protein
MKRAMRYMGSAVLPFVLFVVSPGGADAQSQGDIDAVNRLLDQYTEFEKAMDMPSQAHGRRSPGRGRQMKGPLETRSGPVS